MSKINYDKLKNFAGLHLSFLIFSFAGVASKKASSYPLLSTGFIEFYFIELFIIAVFAYLWQQIIKKFDLITAYSNKGVIIIWMLLWSVLFFKETIKWNNILGGIIVILGIIMVVKDDK